MIENIKLPKIYVNAEFQRLWWTNVSGGLLMGVLLIYALFISAKEGNDWGYLKAIGIFTDFGCTVIGLGGFFGGLGIVNRSICVVYYSG